MKGGSEIDSQTSPQANTQTLGSVHTNNYPGCASLPVVRPLLSAPAPSWARLRDGVIWKSETIHFMKSI